MQRKVERHSRKCFDSFEILLAAIPFLWSSLLGSDSVTWIANEGCPFPVKEVSFVAIMSYYSNHKATQYDKCYQRRVYASQMDTVSTGTTVTYDMVQSSEETLTSE
jgi:hypothetical protein